jgi:hypothetical protein
MVKRWAQSLGADVELCPIAENAESYFGSRVRCVILGMDGQCEKEAEDLLKKIDHEHPATVTLVYTSDAGQAFVLQNKYPRLTTIVKGEGLEELLFSLDAEVRKERVTA